MNTTIEKHKEILRNVYTTWPIGLGRAWIDGYLVNLPEKEAERLKRDMPELIQVGY